MMMSGFFTCVTHEKLFAGLIYGGIRCGMRASTKISVKCSHFNQFNFGEILLKNNSDVPRTCILYIKQAPVIYIHDLVTA